MSTERMSGLAIGIHVTGRILAELAPVVMYPLRKRIAKFERYAAGQYRRVPTTREKPIFVNSMNYNK